MRKIGDKSMRFFFFSSRRRHTRLQGDWSSDVCSSDLRSEDSVALWVDGVRADMQDAGSLGALTAAVPLVIGPGGGTTLRAAVDEVRISRTARAGFAPVLGESDEHYRRRLRIFQRWVLPTPAGLTAVLNDAVGAIAGVA